MQITLINTLYHPEKIVGGAERAVEFLAQWLKHRHRVSVISLHPGKGILEKQLDGVEVTYLGLQNFYWQFDDKLRPAPAKLLWHLVDTWNPLMARQVRLILEKQKPDLVHSHNLMGFSCAVWPAIKQLGLPLIHTLHDYSLLCPKTTMFKNGKNCTHCLDCSILAAPRIRASGLVDAVVGVSRYTLELHLQRGAFTQTPVRKVIHNVPESFPIKFQSSPKPRKLRLGYLGRLHPTKGIEALLESVSQIADPNIELYIAGSGSLEYEIYIKTRFARAEIFFLGFVPPVQLYEKIDVLVVPSLWQEPFGRTCLDALSCGIPVIGSRRGGIVDMLIEGENGFLFEPDNPGELDQIIRSLRTHPEVIQKMHSTIKDKWSDVSLVQPHQEYLAMYQDLLHATDQK